MSAAILILLGFAALVCILSCIGLAAMTGFYNKLHYLAPPAILATAAVAGAVILQEGWSGSAIKALLVLAVVTVSNPVLTHAAAQAKHVRTESHRKE